MVIPLKLNSEINVNFNTPNTLTLNKTKFNKKMFNFFKLKIIFHYKKRFKAYNITSIKKSQGPKECKN